MNNAMDIQRAKEIMDSARIVPVAWNGRSVWIEGINPDQTVNVRPVESDFPQQKVQPEELREVQS